MYYFIIDTCIWLNLGNDIFNTKIIDKMIEFVTNRKVSLILPKLIEEEWNRHKEELIIKNAEKSVVGKFKNIKELSKFISEENQNVASEFLKLEDEIKNGAKKKADEMIRKIEFLFNYKTTKKILYNYEVKEQVIQWGLEKKAPFHKKSSMADTLIILSSIYYIKKYSYYPSIFITANKEDFSSADNPKNIHNDLEELFADNGISYFINIGEALNKVETNTISDQMIEEIEDKSNQFLCHKCGANISDRGAYLRSQYGGLTWQYTCYGCGTRYDTGEFFD